jgi:hypothetical protein
MMAKIAPFLAPCGLTGTVTKTKDPANGLQSLKNKNYHSPPGRYSQCSPIEIDTGFCKKRNAPFRASD